MFGNAGIINTGIKEETKENDTFSLNYFIH